MPPGSRRAGSQKCTTGLVGESGDDLAGAVEAACGDRLGDLFLFELGKVRDLNIGGLDQLRKLQAKELLRWSLVHRNDWTERCVARVAT